jgi:pimeloyl-ACP methyl ester carboxylesterase
MEGGMDTAIGTPVKRGQLAEGAEPPSDGDFGRSGVPLARISNCFAVIFAAIGLLTAACGQTPSASLGRLHACTSDEGPTDARCGTLRVFEDRAAGTGRMISLAIVVLPALSDDDRDDPLVFLAGGPGQGAAKMAPLVRTAFTRIQRHRDIVLVDQRGTGRSHPLNCTPKDDSLKSLLADDEAALARLRECLAAYDANPKLYTTPIAMDDLDDVRAFLGYPTVNLYGGSYGTRAALVYLRQHPTRVRTVILDGVAPTDMRLPLFAARDAGRALDQVLIDCERDAGCAAAYPGLRAKVAEMLSRLERSPVEVTLIHPLAGTPETVTVTPRMVAGALLSGLYAPTTASMVPLLLERATRNDFQSLMALALAGDQSENMSIGMQLSVLCSEDAPRVDDEGVTQASSGSVFGRHLASGQLAACRIWPRGSVPATYSDPVVSEAPALVLSGDLDPVTPPAWGEAVVRHLRNGRHFIARGTGHGVATTPCGVRVVEAFLETGSAAQLDTSCLAEPRRPPFFLKPSGPDPSARPAS